jgi:hypothetical protein
VLSLQPRLCHVTLSAAPLGKIEARIAQLLSVLRHLLFFEFPNGEENLLVALTSRLSSPFFADISSQRTWQENTGFQLQRDVAPAGNGATVGAISVSDAPTRNQ